MVAADESQPDEPASDDPASDTPTSDTPTSDTTPVLQAHGPATAAHTPLVTPSLAHLTVQAAADPPAAGQDPERPAIDLPTRTWMQRQAAAVMAKAPRRALRFALMWWAVISGRRVTGLAAEAAFWVLFSLPWLALAFISGLTAYTRYSGDDTVSVVEQRILGTVERVLTPEAADQYATPIIRDMFEQGGTSLGIIGLVLAVWTGSRAVMTYVEAVTIINGEFGVRGYARRRVLSAVIYVVAVVIGVVMSPVLIIGPTTVGRWLDLPPVVVTWLSILLIVVLATLLLTTLFYISAVIRKAWWASLPGAVLAVVVSVLAGVGLTIYVRGLFAESSVYGVLATPIAVMVFAYAFSLIALMGAAFDAVRIGRPIFVRGTPESTP
ncbi:MAG: YhjD/YihY/BrkB family envelope integrity protein [Candidatus Nanopelagicales bacterium]